MKSFEETAAANDLVVVTGAGGFIGGHLIADLRSKGIRNLRAVDKKPLNRWYQRFDDVDNRQLDLNGADECGEACKGAAYVFNLAADMGGMGFIEKQQGPVHARVLINTHMLVAARDAGVKRFFYSSSACVYAADKQTDADVVALKEEDAYPAMPEDGYGWEKLFSERMCRHFREDFGLATRVARFHNVYGPARHLGRRPREGARRDLPQGDRGRSCPARHEIEIWGDGEQTRSFMYIDDCLTGHQGDHGQRLARADQPRQRRDGHDQPARRHRRGIAGVKLKRKLQPGRSQGRQRPQQRQYADQESIWAGNRASDFAPVWKRPIRGSTMK